jgi:uncharacterized membrane protein
MEVALGLIAIFIGIAVLLTPFGVVHLMRKTRALTQRVELLEGALKGTDKVATASAEPLWEQPKPQSEPVQVVPNAAQVPESTANAVTSNPDAMPKSFVFRGDVFVSAFEWLKENWFLGIAAISLALAGIFTVQYGVEQGLLTPFARIMGALGLGAVFICVGEFTRRRFGDAAGTTRGLASTFSGAGIVTLFAAVLSARHLYDMLPSDLTLIALIGIAALSTVLGWFYGPFLAAVGVAGALGAPFIVGGSSDAPHLFFYYFALIVVMALAIDTVRCWAWVSVFALIGGFLATWLLLISGADAVHALIFGVVVTIAATAILQRRIWPDQGGAMLSDAVLKISRKGGLGWPDFPTRLAGGTFIAAMLLGVAVSLETSTTLENWLGIFSIVALGLLALIWMRSAPALQDLSALAPIAILALLVLLPLDNALIFKDFMGTALLERVEGIPMPRAASVFTGIFAVFAMLGFWRASLGVRGSLIWVGASAFALPLALGALEIFWTPTNIIGAYPWAGHAIASAILMTILAERAAKRWAGDMRPAALYAMSALSLIAFALMLILSAAALSVALAIMIVIAALVDRRFDMAWLGLFTQLAVAVLAWRFLVDPGIPWASWWNTPLWEVVLGYAVPLALMGLAWLVLRPLNRIGAQLSLESAIWSFGAVFILILLERFLRGDIDSFWGLSLSGSVLLTSMGAQLYRWRKGRRLAWVRLGLGTVLGLVASLALFVGLIGRSPLTRSGAREIKGPLLLDTIAVGYLVPAAILAVLAWKLDHLSRYVRAAFAAIAAMMTVAYVVFEIRRFWQGAEIASRSVSQGELYSYTIAMMVASVGLLFIAFARRSHVLRKLAMAGIAVTIAKVFLIDMSGLTGLIRVASFLGLGLALSALAWLSRAMTARWERGGVTQDEPSLDAT